MLQGMLQFKTWFETENIPAGAIKVHLPHGRMQRAGACGAMAFRAICRHFNVGPDDEKDFMKILGTTKNGTWPEVIVKKAKELGFQVRAKTGMTIKDIIKFLDHGIPIICAMQAWGDPSSYKDDGNGHYVVACGYDKKNIYFDDSSIQEVRGVLPIKEFVKRWHDVDAHDHDCDQMGIAMWMDNPKKLKKITKAKKIE